MIDVSTSTVDRFALSALMYRFVARPLAYALLRGSLDTLTSGSPVTVAAVRISPPGKILAGTGGAAALRAAAWELHDAVCVCQDHVGSLGGYVDHVHVDAGGAWVVAVWAADTGGAQRALEAAVLLQPLLQDKQGAHTTHTTNTHIHTHTHTQSHIHIHYPHIVL